MIPRLLMLGGITLGALVQLFLPAWPIFGGVKPPVLAAFVLYYAMRRSTREMWAVAFGAALLHDGLDLGTFGPALLSFPLIGLLAHRVRQEIFVDGIVTHMICGALGAMLVTLMTLLVYTLSGQRPFHFGYAVLRLVGSAGLGMLTLPLVSLAMNKLATALPKRRRYGWQ